MIIKIKTWVLAFLVVIQQFLGTAEFNRAEKIDIIGVKNSCCQTMKVGSDSGAVDVTIVHVTVISSVEVLIT